jgi:hypothetical protein
MDQMRNMLDVFGTTDVQKLKDRFTGVFDIDDPDRQRKLNTLATQLQRMRLSTD